MNMDELQNIVSDLKLQQNPNLDEDLFYGCDILDNALVEMNIKIESLQSELIKVKEERDRLKRVSDFSIDWDSWYMDFGYLDIDKTIEIFKVKEMSASNNYTCTDYDGNEHNTKECIRLPEGLIECWISNWESNK